MSQNTGGAATGDQTTGNQTSYGGLGAAAGASAVDLSGASGNTVNISSAAADAELYMTTSAALTGEQSTAQQAETEAYNLASLVTESNPGVNAYSATQGLQKQDYEFIATTIFALVAFAAWWVYRK